MVRTVQLDEDKHFVKMMHSVKQMKYEEDLCDFTIKVKSHEYQTHKVILSAGSPYFKAMLKHDTKESREGKVEMKDVDAECVKSCLGFIYSGCFDIPDGKTRHLLHVAIMMQLEDVKEAICNILEKELNAENFYSTKSIAGIYNLRGITSKCQLYYKENLMAISSQLGFENEGKSDIFDILKSKKLKLNEDEKITLSLRWVGNNSEKNGFLLEMFSLIKIKEASSGYLSDLLENHPLVCNDLRLYKMLNAPLVESAKEAKSKGSEAHQTLNDKGRLILFDSSNDCLRSFNPATDKITKFHDEKFNRLKNFTAVFMDTYIYILCQNKSVHRLNCRDENSKWEKMRDMIVNHGPCPPTVSLSGCLFVIGSSYEPTKHVEMLNPVINNWVKLKDKPVAMDSHTLVSLDDSIYCIGGRDGCQSVKSFCKFTPLSSEWVDLKPMEKARHGCGAAAVERRIFVMRGCRGYTSTNDVECYDVTSGQWTSLSPMIGSHGCSGAHHFNGWIYLVERGSDSTNVEKYDVENDRWFKVEFKDIESFQIYDSVSI